MRIRAYIVIYNNIKLLPTVESSTRTARPRQNLPIRPKEKREDLQVSWMNYWFEIQVLLHFFINRISTRFICSDTIEERILTVQTLKLQVSNSALTGEKLKSGSKLSLKELRTLFDMEWFELMNQKITFLHFMCSSSIYLSIYQIHIFTYASQ